MFDLKEAYKDITIDEILSNVSEYNLWKHYCKNFDDLDKSFLSELYEDSRPSCRIFISADNTILYKDFGTGECHNWCTYIQAKYNCTFKEALDIVANDFSLRKKKPDIKPNIIIGKLEEPKRAKKKSFIDIISQPYTLTDYDYWKQYHIPLELLEEYNVFSAKHVYLHRGDKVTIFNYNKSNPVYAYRFNGADSYSYKIYFPYANKQYKWLFSGGSADDIEGLDQLPLHGETLILTKSLKDCMCYKLIGYPAISLQGEANRLPNELVVKLLRRFTKIIINYDNDEQGIKSTERLKEQYRFDHFYIDTAKDLSDYIKENNLDRAKELIHNKINDKTKD